MCICEPVSHYIYSVALTIHDGRIEFHRRIGAAYVTIEVKRPGPAAGMNRRNWAC